MNLSDFAIPPKAVAFDLGGTLVDYVGLPLNWSDYYPPAFDRVRSNLGLELDDAAMACATATLTKYNARINPREVEYTSRQIFSEATATWDLRSHSAQDVALCFYGFFQEKMGVFPDAQRILRRLAETGSKIGVLTDLATGMPDEIAMQCISALNCKIDCMLTSAAVGLRKPNTAGYVQLADKLGVKAADCVFFGNEEKDIVGANRAGMLSILLDRRHSGFDYGQAFTVSSLDEILVLLSPSGRLSRLSLDSGQV
jgi:putative hydrolase of the HAD superfamily